MTVVITLVVIFIMTVRITIIMTVVIRVVMTLVIRVVIILVIRVVMTVDMIVEITVAMTVVITVIMTLVIIIIMTVDQKLQKTGQYKLEIESSPPNIFQSKLARFTPDLLCAKFQALQKTSSKKQISPKNQFRINFCILTYHYIVAWAHDTGNAPFDAATWKLGRTRLVSLLMYTTASEPTRVLQVVLLN